MLLKPKHTDNVKGIVIFIVCQMYFPLVLSRRSIRRVNKYAKKRYYVSFGMRWPCNFHFRYVTDKILFTLQVHFARSVSLKFS